MNQFDPRQQFIEGLDRYVSGIETDDGLQKLAANGAPITIGCLPMPLGSCAPSYGHSGASRTATPVPRRSCASASKTARPATSTRGNDGHSMVGHA